MAHYEPPHQDLRCFQIQLFLSLALKVLMRLYDIVLSRIGDMVIYSAKSLITQTDTQYFLLIQSNDLADRVRSLLEEKSSQP